MQKEALSHISNSELLFISIIDRKTGACRVIQSRRMIDTNKIFDFDSSMKKEAAHVLPADQEDFLQKVQLKELNKVLEKEEYCSITVFFKLPDSGRFRRLTYHFTCNKQFPEYILATTEDITENYICDNVTGIKNFAGFKMDCMYEFARSKPHQFVVMNFNIVNFKAVNTMYGYEAGNRLMSKVLELITKSSIHFLAVCRENADNFFCLCRKEDYDFDALNRLCKMNIVNQNGFSDNIELFCGVYFINNDGETLDIICDKARLARRHAEREIGVNTYVLDEEENKRYLNEAVIFATISEAIKNDELVVYFQPIIDTKEQTPNSAEALVRWKHPEKGMIPPNVFIPAVERTGQIAEIDLFVAKKVLEFQKIRFMSGKKMIPISINVSRYDLIQDKYMQQVLNAMREYPEIAEMVRIEITESGMININGRGEAFLNEMRNLGIKTVIDDFGTGYSSLASIADRPCDVVKLDTTFVRHIGVERNMEILLGMTIQTAHYLNVKVVAEGVETRKQYEFLKDKDCDYIQGYYFSKPLPQSEFEKMLDKP